MGAYCGPLNVENVEIAKTCVAGMLGHPTGPLGPGTHSTHAPKVNAQWTICNKTSIFLISHTIVDNPRVRGTTFMKVAAVYKVLETLFLRFTLAPWPAHADPETADAHA